MSEPTGHSKISPKAGPAADGGCGTAGHTLAFLVLRGWLALRAILAGVEKFAGFNTVQHPKIDPVTKMEDPSGVLVEVKEKFYALTNYSAMPQSLQDKFALEPLLPHPVTSLFYSALGPVLIVLGVMLLIGLGTRISLFLQGVLYLCLTAGLMLIRQEDGVAWMGVHVGLVALALMLSKYNRICLLKKL